MTSTLEHTEKKPTRRHRSPHGLGRYVTDLELIEWLGVPPKEAREALTILDRDPRSGFPKKQPLWGDRRYLPAIEAWLDKTNGLKIDAPDKRRTS